ncbi:MAG: chaperone modulator CbpM [Saprospiraceae bacterium]|nr:chaperone modulator CbpM [Saprospiraceae bacterium]
METENLILIDTVCSHHNIEVSFVSSLQEYGLIEVVEVADHQYLSNEQLRDFEKMMRLHYELNINLEGIDVIARLLQRIDDLQQELVAAKNKLILLE